MTGDEQPLVSVVTPFYNTEDYLGEAIESVLAQTYRNYEYILVNNRSTDRSVEIAERYARRDPRIRLLHNDTFLTQLQNYNQALRKISPASRYFKMVQADDLVFPRCLEEMVAVAEAHPEVGIVGSYRMAGRNVEPRGLPHTKTVMSGREACRLVLIDDIFLFGTQTTLLVRADIVRARDPFYGEDRLFPDTDAAFSILERHDFAFVHQVLSFTRLEEESIYGKMASYNPYLLGRVIMLKSFGRKHLTPEEYARHAGEAVKLHHRFLADAWLHRREPEFWEFHRKGLANAGEEIDRSAVRRAAVPVVLRRLFPAQGLVGGLLRKVRGLFRRG
jgi:glycosyltransferase involved in cell wall biosynthesis